jgi:hypothetical protein
MLKSLCLGLAVLLGDALEANGIFMLVSPENWYLAVPGVTSTGAASDTINKRPTGGRLSAIFVAALFPVPAEKSRCAGP